MSRYRVLGGFLALAVLWGTSFVATEAGLAAGLPPVLFAAFRFDLAGLLVLAYAARATDRWRPRGRAEWRVVLAGAATFVAAHHALLFVGQQYVTPAVAAVVIALDPVLAAAFAAAVLPEERLAPLGVVGLLAGTAGVAAMASPDPTNLATADLLGVGLVFLAAAAFAAGAVLTRAWRSRLPASTLQAWMMLAGAPMLHATSLAAGEPQAVEWTPTGALALGYLVVAAGGVGYLLYFGLLDRLGPVEINLVGYATPPFAALVGWVALGQGVESTTVVGFCCVLAGFALVKRRALAAEVARLRAA